MDKSTCSGKSGEWAIVLTQYIYEGDSPTPILSHQFIGKTADEARAIMGIHAQYDAFLRAALTTKDWNGTPLRTEEKWSSLPF